MIDNIDRAASALTAVEAFRCAHHGETTTDIGRDWDDLIIPDLDNEYDEDLDDKE